MLYRLFSKYFRRKWAELSWGELFDKISILKVKMNRMTVMNMEDAAKVEQVTKQWRTLSDRLHNHTSKTMTVKEIDKVYTLFMELYENNYQQWDYENAMSMTGESVSVEERLTAMQNSYTQNRKRHIIKRKIDEIFKSEYVEIKQYDGMKNETL